MSEVFLKTTSILNVPIHTYMDDFSFIVNNKKFKTTRLIADLISPTISKLHLIDPTINNFTIKTNKQGDFLNILNLVDFQKKQISEKEFPFFFEVAEILGNESFEYQIEQENIEINSNNVFTLINKHEKYQKIYYEFYSKEVDFISSHFYELCEDKEEEFIKISLITLIEILENANFQINSEDQLIKFANNLYNLDSKYSILFEYICFENVSSQMMKEFFSIFDINYINSKIWNNLTNYFNDEINIQKQYRKLSFSPHFYEFKGIFNYLQKLSNGNIKNEIFIESLKGITIDENPYNVVMFDNNCHYESANIPNSFLNFYFKNRRVKPTYYTIKSYPCGVGGHHLKSWVIEGSNDNKNWETISEENDNSYLNGKNQVHTFSINKPNSKYYQYIRIRTNRENWFKDDKQYRLSMDSFEIYGTLLNDLKIKNNK